MRTRPNRKLAVLALAFALLPQPARAVLPDEIQVYTDDINAPCALGLEYHAEPGPLGRPVPLHFAVGRGLNEAAEKWPVKAIFEFSFGKP